MIARSRLDRRLAQLDQVSELLLASRARLGQVGRDFEFRRQVPTLPPRDPGAGRGPQRDDGLAVYPGPVAGREGVVASPWTPPADVRPEIVWAALDCPAGWAVDDFQREGVLLGRMAAHIDRLPVAGHPHVLLGWRIGEDGRKRYAGSALFTVGGDLLAAARSTWIVPDGREP
jgi:hypothetical protein